MSTTLYIYRLQQLRTYQVGIIEDIQEYQYKRHFAGLFKRLPPLPQANTDRHVIAVTVKGEQPNEIIILPDDRQAIEPSILDVDKLVFMFLNMKLQQLKIASPPRGYRLADGQEIMVDFELMVQVTNAKDFWLAAKDPIAILEAMVINETQSYFLNMGSRSLVDKPLPSAQQADQQSLESRLRGAVQSLAANVRNISLAGIQIKQVYAQVNLSDQLRTFLKRQLDTVYDPAGLLDRRHVDERIDNHHVFEMFRLRDVIMALDTRLLERFYSNPYGEAIYAVYEKLADAKAKYVEEQQNAKIAKLKQAIATAVDAKLDEIPVNTLKEKLAEELYKLADDIKQTETPSTEEFILRELKVKAHI